MGSHHPQPESPRLRRLAVAVVVPIAVLTLVALVALWPSGGVPVPEGPASQAQTTGDVVAVQRGECPEPLPEQQAPQVNGCGTAEVRLTEGADAGGTVTTTLPNRPGAPRVDEGDHVVLIRSPVDATYSIVDHQRASGLWVLVVAFVLALVAFGRWRGVSALVGLAVTFALLVLFVVPAVLAGEPPVLVAVVASAAIILAVLYLTHGFSLATTVAVLGTLSSLALTGVLSAVAVSGLRLTGITDDLSTALGVDHPVNMEGLLVAGIVIGSLGVLDDVTVTQAATVTELARANPAYGAAQLYRAGGRVGRAHIASVVNTIVLAYAGSSLPLLVLIVANVDSLGGVVTDQVIAQEIVRSIVATLGLIAAVPITTALAAATAGRVTDEVPG